MGPKKKPSQTRGRSEALDSVADTAAAANEEGDDLDGVGAGPDGAKPSAEAVMGDEALERDREEMRKLHDRKEALTRTSHILG